MSQVLTTSHDTRQALRALVPHLEAAALRQGSRPMLPSRLVTPHADQAAITLTLSAAEATVLWAAAQCVLLVGVADE